MPSLPKPPFRRWLRAWALAVAAASLVTALATGAYVVSQAQLLGFGIPMPFAEKPLSLMARQFAGGLLWGGAAGILFAMPGVAVALGVVALYWASFAKAPWWLWALLGAGFGVLLALPIFGAATGFFAETIAALAGGGAMEIARRKFLANSHCNPPC